MIDAISSIASSLASATVLTRAVLGMKIDSEVIAKVSVLQSEIMTAQSAALTSLAERALLMSRVAELEQVLRQTQDWESQAKRYRLTEFPSGAQVYVLRPDCAEDEPEHRICPKCFEDRKRSIIQTTNRHSGGEVVKCPNCNLELTLSKFNKRVVRVDSGRNYDF